MQKIVLASNNAGKIKELNRLLGSLDITVVSQKELNIPSIEETGQTFIENAILKARHAAAVSGLPALADDSGLEVDALQGAPGIYSARFAGESASDQDNNAKLLQLLANTPTGARTARFHCVLAFMRHEADPVPIICHGAWEGSIAEQASGGGGFGYDPLFWLSDRQCTSAELTPEQKNALSHRGQAMAQLVAELTRLYG
ncbi:MULTISPECIES: XTP/dITP diphosphatase [unclassified Hahella]|uniref:XTP/dITP diphosphatase n=1 Tax=unclassified Hahella TaxID=2624107 RepID=UPI001C1EED7A|nr:MULTISPECIES: XTP/dITP diphosphatase [unclassified Hahella]MBU6952687.1 XTP/dITP diphosphatase [Hahella sp. HN01]MDG9667098.1 XTP/dITP diphosphatase [Hahella sp. CR1]